MTRTTLRSAEFRRGREESWRRLEENVIRVEKSGISVLSADELQQLPLLYRSVASSLSVARSIVLDRSLLLYLENLALRAYLVVYGPRVGITKSLTEFFARGFPRSVREMRRHLAVVFLAMTVGTFAGFSMVWADAAWFDLLVPRDLAGERGAGSSAASLMRDELFAPWPGFVDAFLVFANTLFRHNTMVGILSFGLSFALGIPTLFLIAYNGLILGAFIALHAERGLTVAFLGWLSIHGVTEILAILLCGAAGLVVAEKILFPGPLPRVESLGLHGRRAAGVVAGSVALFFVAGFLEGGFRQLVNNTFGRYAFAAATAALWLYYFLFVGRDRPR
jgi:uncharacterized membrane protein SpoIIM required for sporulation